MRKLFERTQKEIEDFIDQRDDLVMLARCTENDRALILNIISDIEQATGTDVFLLFGDSFIDTEQYVSAVFKRFSEEHRIACEAAIEEGKPPLEPVHGKITDFSLSPEDRLRELITFARSLVPSDGGHRLVCVMFPDIITDKRAYLKMISSLVPWQGVKPWMRGTRLIFRYDSDTAKSADFEKMPRVKFTSFDMGSSAIEESMKADMENENLPLEDRMQSLFSLAIIEYAHNRVDESIEKFRILLGYFQSTENDLMQAMVLNGIGDACRHCYKDLDQARHWYECAVIPANDSEIPVVMATVIKNLGDVAYEQKRYAEAEQFFDNLDKLASHMADPDCKAGALEWRGLSQEKQKLDDSAIESWEAAAKLSRSVDMPYFLKPNLEHLLRIYKKIGIKEKTAYIKNELKNLETQGDIA